MSGDESGSETDDDDVIVDGQPRRRRRKKSSSKISKEKMAEIQAKIEADRRKLAETKVCLCFFFDMKIFMHITVSSLLKYSSMM